MIDRIICEVPIELPITWETVSDFGACHICKSVGACVCGVRRHKIEVSKAHIDTRQIDLVIEFLEKLTNLRVYTKR